ncbi:MAG TPA: hypothetical protein EYP35_11555 [Desulfobacterales bacterium]|nr:hypothetical protein [Desulfobacterales bacterium]
MKKVAIIGLLASVEYEAIQGMTVLGNTEQKADAEHYATIGYKCPARVQLADVKVDEDSTLIFVPSKEAIEQNVNVQFLPMSEEDREHNNYEVIITVMGALTSSTGKKLNVIPNKFNLGSVLVV